MADLKMKILAVDDFGTMRRIIKNILGEIGYVNILEADNGLRALDVLRQEKVESIISDWNMPEMPGIELLKAVRACEEWKDLPFLMASAEGQKENVLEAVKHKVTNY